MMAKPMWSFTPMGEAALLVECGLADVAAANQQALALARALTPHVQALPAINSVLVRFDPLLMPAEETEALVRSKLAALSANEGEGHRRVVEMAVRYGGEAGPDLDDAAQALGLTPDQLIAQHSAAPLRVLMIGFAPGFPYIGPLPPTLHLPRRSTPRSAVPAGSVAIAAGMTGIYPSTLPGGWHLIGQTDATLFDPQREQPALLQAGDWVQFTAR